MRYVSFLVGVVLVLGLSASESIGYQAGGSLTGPGVMTSPAGNTIEVPAGVTVQYWFGSNDPPPGETIEIDGANTTIGLNAPGSSSDVIGDNTTTNHNASPTTSHTDGNGHTTTTTGPSTTTSTPTAHGTESVTTTQP